MNLFFLFYLYSWCLCVFVVKYLVPVAFDSICKRLRLGAAKRGEALLNYKMVSLPFRYAIVGCSQPRLTSLFISKARSGTLIATQQIADD